LLSRFSSFDNERFGFENPYFVHPAITHGKFTKVFSNRGLIVWQKGNEKG
jgi:hypothetical protein